VSKHLSLPAVLGVLAVAALAWTGSLMIGAANTLYFDPSDYAVSPPVHSSRQCRQWNADIMDWTWVCRGGAYQSAHQANPFQAPTPVRYDYPSYGPGISGSSLAFVIDLSSQDHVKPPAHAD
jgi:hypothetical protein